LLDFIIIIIIIKIFKFHVIIELQIKANFEVIFVII